MDLEHDRRNRHAVALAAALPKLLDKAFRRRGFAETSIVTEWSAIVGETLAREATPQKLVFPRGSGTGATLHIRVKSSYATELQHNSPLVIERINGYFGFAAVARIALTQGPSAGGDNAPKKLLRPAQVPVGWARDHVRGIRDGGLRRALSRFGRSVLEGRDPDGP